MEGREIRLGALTFIADNSAWLQEAPLDIDALPVRGATHFRVCPWRPPAAAVDPVSVGSCGVFTPCSPPAQAFRSVEVPAAGEARGGSPVGHPSGRGNRARRKTLRPVRLAPSRPHPSAIAATLRLKS